MHACLQIRMFVFQSNPFVRAARYPVGIFAAFVLTASANSSCGCDPWSVSISESCSRQISLAVARLHDSVD